MPSSAIMNAMPDYRKKALVFMDDVGWLMTPAARRARGPVGVLRTPE